MHERLLKILEEVGSPRVLLVGDFMLDHYLYGNADRISPEAPVVVMNVTERHERPGGAGSVAVDLAALGARVKCLGVVGADENGKKLRATLSELDRINIDGLIEDPERPTTSKQRIIGLAQHRHRQQLMRIDEENCSDIGPAVQKQMNKMLEKLIGSCDVVCIEDYNKGVFRGEFAGKVIKLAEEHNKAVIADPGACNDYGRYGGAWLIKPNRRELALASGIELNSGISGIAQAAGKLAAEFDIENLVVTLDKQGAFVYQHNAETDDEKSKLVATRPRNVYDVTGAGDMVLAMLGLLKGGQYQNIEPPTLSEMVALANIAGGLEVEKFGSVGIKREEIVAELVKERQSEIGKLRSLSALEAELKWHRQQEHKIVFTNGCFDILHPGHLNLLSFAKSQGDVLIVALNSDKSVRALKGPTRPILHEHERAVMMSALEPVDYVIIFEELDPENVIRQITPDVLIKGSDWDGNVVGQEWVEQHGGKVVLKPLEKGHSTSNIIEKVIERHKDQLS
ncbi:MAG: bifunctional heptose 7-phosphate kinase/heptose 1-phosphate adenyltransferase [Sedimentisphaerales bacterium]|nr:bifunctional heptose 7-phosphate kinase/heptose 1-phosphate adenyltransferase [Sedimentisphaerales bacterium]